jgi:hypothetical protein
MFPAQAGRFIGASAHLVSAIGEIDPFALAIERGVIRESRCHPRPGTVSLAMFSKS